MSWLDDIGDAASKSFAGDKLVLAAVAAGVLLVGAAWWLLGQLGVVDPVFGCAKCEAAKKLRLVLVEFADREDSMAAFSGTRAQYVNLNQYGLGDPQVTTAHQMFRRPPIVVKVSPPMATTVTLRLLRNEANRGFPSGSERLSAREQQIEHLQWHPHATATVQTNSSGEGKLDPGMRLPHTAGFEYRVQGSVNGQPFVTSSNAVVVKRRLAIRQVICYPPAQTVVTAALAKLRALLEPLDLELHELPVAFGPPLGVRERDDEFHGRPGATALDETPAIQAFNPHSIAIVVGEFAATKVETQTFEVEHLRDKGRFPARVRIPLTAGTRYSTIPLSDGSQFIGAWVRYDRPAGSVELQAAEVNDLSVFAPEVTVSLDRILPSIPATATTIAISVKLRVMNGWPVGWAYGAGVPVIYLNMRDPITNALLDAHSTTALILHELGHKLGLTSSGANALDPDQQPHHYGTGVEGLNHVGPHCASGVTPGYGLTDKLANQVASCAMWGALSGRHQFCPECRTTLRKRSLEAGYFKA